MGFFLLIALIGIAYCRLSIQKGIAGRMPESRICRLRRIQELPVGCTGHISAGSVRVDAADNTCYLYPGGLYDDRPWSGVSIRREWAGYVLSVQSRSVRFTSLRPLSWLEKRGLLRVVRVEESHRTGTSFLLIRPEEPCHPLPCDEAPAVPGPVASTTAFSQRAKPSYQTAPLAGYSPELRELATKLFEAVSQRVGRTRAKRYKGSFSVLAASGSHTAAKILIYESGKGKTNGDWSNLRDGVYVLFRATGALGEATLGALDRDATLGEKLDRNRTIGIAPKHTEQFAYLRVDSACDIDEIGKLIHACAMFSSGIPSTDPSSRLVPTR
jgi:hypothetical protein